MALVNIIRCGGGDTYDMDRHAHLHLHLSPHPCASSDDSVIPSVGEGAGEGDAGGGGDGMKDVSSSSSQSQPLYEQEDHQSHHALSAHIPISSDGEIGEVSLQDLLSHPMMQNSSLEDSKGKQNMSSRGDGTVREVKVSAVKGGVAGTALYCEPCVEEGVVESQQIAAVQDTSGALSFNQKGETSYHRFFSNHIYVLLRI